MASRAKTTSPSYGVYPLRNPANHRIRTLTTLEAIDLLKTRPPAETTAEELAALRDLVSRLPSLYPLLGGREKVDRFLAAADAAQAEPVAPPPVVVEEPAEAQPIAKIANWVDSLTPRRLVEISLFVVVFAWGIAWLISHLSGSSSSSGDGPKTATASAGEMGPAAAQPAPVEPSPNQLAMAQLPAAHEEFPLEEPDGIWHGWKVVAESGGRAEMKSAWDLSNPTVPRPTRRLFTGGGRVTLTRTWEIPAGAKSLRIECAQSSPGAAGTLELQIDGHPLGKSIVPPAEATWQPQITLGAAAGKSVTATLIYTPGNADEQLEWRQVVASPESMEVMSAGTDPDPTKPALRLWLRADAGVKDAAGRECGTGGAEATVQTWEDQSQRHARLQCDEGNAAQRPTLVLHHPLIGGRAAVAFEGDDFLRAKQSVIYPGAISTTLAVMQIASQTSTLIDTSAPRYCLSIENRPRRRKGRHSSAGGQSLSFDAPTRLTLDVSAFNGRFMTALLQVRGATSSLDVCRTLRAAGNLAGGPCGDQFVIGQLPGAPPPTPPPMAKPGAPAAAAPPAPPTGPAFHLAELLIYDRELSESEIGQLGRYLQAKYGLVGCY